ncbi:MAG: ribonuclease [Polaromonas sp.]|nr:ribonuclease [Polaromonas sp.]
MFCIWDGSLTKKSAKPAIMAGLLSLGLMLASTGLVHGAVSETIAQTQLPAQGQDVMRLIFEGGPFKYEKDGTVFGNREKILPAKNRGFYREYTVKTPGERTRGARRIVCGGLKPAAPEACYYTDNHYASFRKIAK